MSWRCSANEAFGVVYPGGAPAKLAGVQWTGQEKWKFKSRFPIASSPAIADGRVYFVSSTGALAAIDAATGQPAWVFAGESVRATAMVFVGSFDGNLYALN